MCPIALDVVRFILENNPAMANTSTRPGQDRRMHACAAALAPSGGRKPVGKRDLVTLLSSITMKFQRPLG
jgi:hypothetical protein